MLSISVKYLPCTDYKGSRLVADDGRHRKTISYPDDTRRGAPTAWQAVEALIKSGNSISQSFMDWIFSIGYLERSNLWIFTPVCLRDSDFGRQCMARELSGTASESFIWFGKEQS